MTFLTTFLRSQLFFTPTYPTADFSDQVVIVTGSNTGLGLEAVKHLVRLNAARVILAVRSVEKGEAAVEHVIATTQCLPTRLEVWYLDLANYASIQRFGDRVRQLERLDAVVQNAGILTFKWGTAEGHEMHIATNVIGASLLGLEVLPKLRESAEKYRARGRLSFVGSELQYIAKFSEKELPGSILDALNDKEHADLDDRYKVSKLLLLYAVRAIARTSPLTPQSDVVINYLTPGLCKSDIFRDEVPWFQGMVIQLSAVFLARTTEVGSRALVHAIAPDVGAETHGAFLVDGKVAPNGANVEGQANKELEEKFCKELFARLEQIKPGVTSV
ncbi:uncharacterized protein K452DRAFT_266972 [Aplosporella prunicola CBS 121167]|uniref:Ketoreductase (KR) domain-containing protein n=1 Tax=Aplosporella prunicola CBS 121167 TaxID=1176127 RepID=A0A6A6BPR6_9PEZI|nr:uncharacterized protein K452DRAFT_266972 [Aplosporella prunicola CBS 121167]KAF2144827.1 hypothetical protein K452DRAFT_266972 [Aplosporella prunicola CBS 121167]